MESRAKVFGHAIHPMLIVFPLGLLATAVIFDVIYLLTGNGQWTLVSYWMIAAGMIGALAAALFGFIDWWAIPAGTRAKSLGLLHGVGNVVVLALFALSWWLRRGVGPPDYVPETLPLILSFAGVVLALVTGWMGGELIERLGVSVHPGAHLDAPSSLSGRPASASDDRR